MMDFENNNYDKKVFVSASEKDLAVHYQAYYMATYLMKKILDIK